jgi:uncharacterized protein (DUF433 family)
MYLPVYSVVDAARYAQTHRSTVWRWYHSRRAENVLRGKADGERLSYLQLIEVALVSQFRRCGISLRRIREAHGYLSDLIGTEYPFAQTRLKTDRVHLFLELPEEHPRADVGKFIVTDDHGQLAWANMYDALDYEDFLAVRWFVRGREVPISIDPRVAFGSPTVNGVPTWALKESFNAGESLEEIQANYEIPMKDLRFALQFEKVPVAA